MNKIGRSPKRTRYPFRYSQFAKSHGQES